MLYIIENIVMTFSECIAYESHVFVADTSQELTMRTPEIGGPYFDAAMLSNVTGLAGETIQLACKVKDLGNKTVCLRYISFMFFEIYLFVSI